MAGTGGHTEAAEAARLHRPRPWPLVERWGVSARGLLWIGALLLAVSAPVLVLLASAGPAPVSFWWDFSMGLGFCGLALMGTQFVLTARFRRLASPFGMDVVYLAHRYFAWVAFALVAAHFAILWLLYDEELGSLNPLTARWELTVGRAALLLFGLAVVTSEWRRQLRLEYGLWRYLHVAFATGGLTAGIAHILGVGNYTALAPKTALWLGLTLFSLALVAWIRVAKPWGQIRAPYRVAEVRPEGDGSSWTLAIEPDGHPGLRRFSPGQFGWLTLRDSPFLLREHPFSIASAPQQLPRLEFGIKGLGDFTRTIGDVRPGERVYLDAPYGVFSIDTLPHAGGYVFAVGGIGITPVRGMLRSLAASGDRRPLWLFYGIGTLDDAPYLDELSGLAASLALVLVPVVQDPPEDWEGESGFVDRAVLERHLPGDRGGLACFLCGPQPMVDATGGALEELGIPASHIRSEVFEFV